MHAEDRVTRALDRLDSKLDRIAAGAQDHRSQIAADLASLCKEVRDGMEALNERVATLELAARSAEAIQAAYQPEHAPSEPAPPQLVNALRGPNRGAPIAVPLDIPGMGTLVGHIDPAVDVDPDKTWRGVVTAFRRPVA
ncbi:MAG: hypothetical protein JWO67_2045 [Streptosporangiaceae bacterium]|nr:hypothetical protein [Streptosporangiaceae bacterium]